MTQKGFATIPFLVIIAILSAGIIGGSLYVKSAHPELIQKQKTPQLSTQTVQQATPIPTAMTQATNPTTGKSYINNAYNYSIVFPTTDWIFNQEDRATQTILLPKSLNYDQENYGTSLLIGVFTDDSSTYPVKTQAQFDEWFKKEKSTEEIRVEPQIGHPPTYLSKIGNTNIDNNPAQQFNRRGMRGDGTEPWYSIVTWVRRNNLNYYIEMLGKEVTVKNFITQYNDIISTFKFIQN